MDVYLVQVVKGRRSVVVDASNWDVVPLKMRHLLVVEGLVGSLLPQHVDVEKYVRDLAELYVEVVDQLKKAGDVAARKCVGRMAGLLTSFSEAQDVDVVALMETKTWIERVLKVLADGGETFSGRGRLTVEGGRVHLEGLYSPGHTYLYKAGVLRL